RGVAEQHDIAVAPGIHGFAIDHRILEHFVRAANHGGNVDPVVIPLREVMDEILVLHPLVPVAMRPAVFVVDGDFCDPVDIGESSVRIGWRNRVEHHALTMRAQPHERGAGTNRFSPGDAAPHDRAAPLNRRLRRMHLLAHGRMQAVSGDQQASCHFRTRTRSVLQYGADAFAVRMIAITGDLHASADRLRSEPFQYRAIQQHLKLAAMHGVLRPVVAGTQTARLGVNVVAVESDQGPFLSLDTDCRERLWAKAQLVELAHGIGLQVDADSQRLDLGDTFEDVARHADLVQRERSAETADTGARDQNRTVAHSAPRRLPPFLPLWLLLSLFVVSCVARPSKAMSSLKSTVWPQAGSAV